MKATLQQVRLVFISASTGPRVMHPDGPTLAGCPAAEDGWRTTGCSHHSPHLRCNAVQCTSLTDWRCVSQVCEPTEVQARLNVLVRTLLFPHERSMLWGCCAGSYDGTVFVWELVRNTVVATLNGSGNAPVLGCSWSPQAGSSAFPQTLPSQLWPAVERECRLYS